MSRKPPVKRIFSEKEAAEASREGAVLEQVIASKLQQLVKRLVILAVVVVLAWLAIMKAANLIESRPSTFGDWAGDNGYSSGRTMPQKVDASRTAAIGYCFGGSVVLSMANAGYDLDAVAAFHGGIGLPIWPGEDEVKAKVLVCNGADDPFVTSEQLTNFKNK